MNGLPFNDAHLSQGPVAVLRLRMEAGWPIEAVAGNAAIVFGCNAADRSDGDLAYAELIHRDDVPQVREEFARRLDGGPDRFQHRDHRLLDADGSVRWVQQTTVLERDEQGTARTAVAFIVDVTQLKQAEATERAAADRALRQSEKRLRSAIGSLLEGFAYFDAEDRLVLFNDAYRKRNPKADQALEEGWTYEDLLRANVARGVLVEARGNEETFIRERLARHRNPGPPIIRNFDDGRTYLVKENRTDDGGTALSFIDITDLNEATEELKAAKTEAEGVKALLQDALESTTEAFAIFDKDGRLVVFNEAYRSLYRHSKDLLQSGMSFEVMLRERAARGMIPDIGDDVEDWIEWRLGIFMRCEGPVERIFPDGTWWKMNEQRTPTGGIAQILTDITVIKEREERLRESEARFRNLFNHTSVGAAIIGLDGGFRAVNEALCNMLGYSETELTGMSLLNLAFPEDQVDFIRALGAYNAGDAESWPHERRFRRRDGKAIVTDMTAVLVRDAERRPAYVVVHVQDVGNRAAAAEAG